MNFNTNDFNVGEDSFDKLTEDACLALHFLPRTRNFIQYEVDLPTPNTNNTTIMVTTEHGSPRHTNRRLLKEFAVRLALLHKAHTTSGSGECSLIGNTTCFEMLASQCPCCPDSKVAVIISKIVGRREFD